MVTSGLILAVCRDIAVKQVSDDGVRLKVLLDLRQNGTDKKSD